jgi:homoserine O-acetyltransferase
MAPERVERLLIAASTAAASADQLAWCRPQLLAIRQDPDFAGGDYYDRPPGRGPHLGLGLARRIAHITYRSGTEINLRFGREPQHGENPLGESGRYAIESYLDHHADKLVRRFDANSYLVLTEAMNSHDVGRGRGGTAAALARITARTTVLAISSDRLYTVHESEALVRQIGSATPLIVAESPFGHDGFLLETASLADALKALFAESSEHAGCR